MSGLYQDDFQIFSPGEIALLRKGGRILHDCLGLIAAMVAPGVATKQLDEAAEAFICDHGAEPAFKGYRDYPFTLCTSVNDVCVHGLPSDQALREGDIVALDCGVRHGGLCTDACVTVGVGEISHEAQNLLTATKRALKAGLRKVETGAQTGDISAAINRLLTQAGFDAVRQLTGHGLGATLHQFPEIPNFGRAGEGPVLPAGTVVAIEPISSAGSIDIREDPDKWTLRTADGSLSAHFEHTVLVIDGGCEILT